MVPRILHLHPKTYSLLIRLCKQAEQDGAYRVAKRLQAVVLNSEGRTSGELANLLKAPRSRVSEWLARYQAHGVEGLLEGHRSGRPLELTPAQQKQLDDILDSGPVAYGLDTGIWTSPMVAWVIKEEFGIHYHPGHVRRLLHRLGFSDRWQRYTYPSLKKKRSDKTGR
jgi:transposase